MKGEKKLLYMIIWEDYGYTEHMDVDSIDELMIKILKRAEHMGYPKMIYRRE